MHLQIPLNRPLERLAITSKIIIPVLMENHPFGGKVVQSRRNSYLFRGGSQCQKGVYLKVPLAACKQKLELKPTG